MAATLVLAALWLAFAVSHIGLSSARLRPRLVARLGEGAFLGLYSALALAVFVPLVWFYVVHRHAGPLLWALPVATPLRWTLYAVMGVAWVLIAGGLVEPSPALLGAGGNPRVRGIHRITRHPLFMGMGLFGALHLVWNGFASDLAFWAGFPLFALVGCAHQDRRKLASQHSAYRAWHAQTPFLPFTGRETLRGLRELRPLSLALGVGLAIALRQLHGPLFRG